MGEELMSYIIFRGVLRHSSWFSLHNSGGGANHLCMPKVPENNLPNCANDDNHGLLYGAEYEGPIQGIQDHNVPCAVCHVSTRSAVLMIPGNTTCP